MAQKLIQTQTQQQVQQQRLSQQQLLQVKLLEMPLAELEQSIGAELDDNPALEEKRDDDAPEQDNVGGDDASDTAADDSYEDRTEREEREEALDNALESLGSDDEMPEPTHGGSQASQDADYEETVWGDTTSFYDKLKEQMGETELTERQRQIMEYLIGSLDGDGLLRKSLDDIDDELAIYQGIDVPVEEIAKVLRMLQSFDPAGIGARSLQECLSLQIARRPSGKLKDMMMEVVERHFDDFIKKHWDKIAQSMGLTNDQAAIIHDEIRKLNPKPGAALGETEAQKPAADNARLHRGHRRRRQRDLHHQRRAHTRPEGIANVHRHGRHLPHQQAEHEPQGERGSALRQGEADKAQGYIEAVKQRRHTLFVTMKAIINWQKRFFQNGDEADLKPMKLKDIEEKTGLDSSTISRVSNMKYAQTRWGTFPLRFFFTDGYVTKDGEEMSTRKLKLALKDLINHEDKSKPLSDDVLAKEMKKMGYPLARRTVAKYREQLGLPVARLRRC